MICSYSNMTVASSVQSQRLLSIFLWNEEKYRITYHIEKTAHNVSLIARTRCREHPHAKTRAAVCTLLLLVNVGVPVDRGVLAVGCAVVTAAGWRLRAVLADAPHACHVAHAQARLAWIRVTYAATLA